MNGPWIWLIASAYVVVTLTTLVYLFRQQLPNLGNTILTFVSLAVSIGSLYIAIATYQQAIRDSEQQQKNLDASRVQLQAVVNAATQQQQILSKNLEISRAQQELLSRGLETSKFQQEIQRKNLETSKAQLSMLEEQQKRETERLARKPIAEVSLLTGAGPKLLADLEKGEIEFPVDENKKWFRLNFFVSNRGTAEIIKPITKFWASPETVLIDRPDQRGIGRADHNTIQFSGPTINDIEPVEVAGAVKYAVDITVPDSVNAFDLGYIISGKNMARKEHTLHFRVVRPPS